MGPNLPRVGAAIAIAVSAVAAPGCGGGSTTGDGARAADRGDGPRAAARGDGSRAADRAGAAAGAGPRLILAGDGELWDVDVRAGRARRDPRSELAGGDPPHRVVRRGDRYVFWGSGMPAGDPSAGGGLQPLAGRDTAFFLPSAHPRRVWLTFFDSESPARQPRFWAVREVDARGRVTAGDARPPPGWPERAARSGLLLSQRTPRYVLWNPRTDAVVNVLDARKIGDLGPVHQDTLVSCTAPCTTLRLTDVRTDAQRRVSAPAGLRFEPAYAAFSSTGGELAIPVRGAHARRGAHRLALVKMERPPAVKPIPGSRVPEGYVFTGWSRDDRHVFITGGHGRDGAVIVAYDRNRARARRLPLETGPFYGMAAG